MYTIDECPKHFGQLRTFPEWDSVCFGNQRSTGKDGCDPWRHFDPSFLVKSMEYVCSGSLSIEYECGHTLYDDETDRGSDLSIWNHMTVEGKFIDLVDCMNMVGEVSCLVEGLTKSGMDLWRWTNWNSQSDFSTDFTAAAYPFPKDKVGQLIGKGGHRIRKIQQRSGSVVHVSTKSVRSIHMTMVIIVGTRKQCRTALKMLKNVKKALCRWDDISKANKEFFEQSHPHPSALKLPAIHIYIWRPYSLWFMRHRFKLRPGTRRCLHYSNVCYSSIKIF